MWIYLLLVDFLQASDGSYKPSCDSCFNKIPFGSTLHPAANKMRLLEAEVILVLGQKSTDNGLAFLPACLFMFIKWLISYIGLKFTLGIFRYGLSGQAYLAVKQVPRVLRQEIDTFLCVSWLFLRWGTHSWQPSPQSLADLKSTTVTAGTKEFVQTY